MRPEQRTMNIETYHKCIEICVETKSARDGKKIRLRDYPAAIVKCADSWTNPTATAIEKSGKVDNNSYHNTPNLEDALNALGDIGKKRNECNNCIGSCAEPHSARTVLRENPNKGVKQLVFGYAYRPRTKTVIRYCRNCTDVFDVQNP